MGIATHLFETGSRGAISGLETGSPSNIELETGSRLEPSRWEVGDSRLGSRDGEPRLDRI